MTFLHQAIQLRNRYFGFRHGLSKANTQGIILSDPYDGQLEEFSLNEEGEIQVRMSVTHSKQSGQLDSKTLIISSLLSRCRRTAEIAQEVLDTTHQILFDERLRERWFGDWERGSNTHYNDVWMDDATDPNHTNANVESAMAVQQRTDSLIETLERRYVGRRILLVSHGDALQIMQTGFAKQCASKHRSLRHLETAEIRELHLSDSK